MSKLFYCICFIYFIYERFYTKKERNMNVNVSTVMTDGGGGAAKVKPEGLFSKYQKRLKELKEKQNTINNQLINISEKRSAIKNAQEILISKVQVEKELKRTQDAMDEPIKSSKSEFQ